ncbi:hypothetical protein AMATHDRAFT_42980 [Amanita thiersii Skay4041]|uniref:BTB domain-containing protein n=1 Tax=Amanita thiersii Skay4041 TaxID=703135 RepID=A0A2A9NGI1_9AGAR|nr:hypothetical protein AMATHDRAFT_42980 [Amanita thiersii Skay4041]
MDASEFAVVSPTPVYLKHETYYFADIYFVFDETLFKVPQLYLQESPIISAALKSKSTAVVDHAKGSSGIKGNGTFQSPLVCDGVDKEAFIALLGVLFPTLFPRNPSLTTKDWTKVLDLSFQWELHEVHSTAIRHLGFERLDAIEKLALANKYVIKGWIMPAIKELVEEDRQLSEQDAMRIGVEVALRIARSQGEAQGGRAKSKPSHPVRNPSRTSSMERIDNLVEGPAVPLSPKMDSGLPETTFQFFQITTHSHPYYQMDTPVDTTTMALFLTPVYLKHEKYYFTDLYFLFDETLFKIPQLYIQESPVIKEALQNKSPTDDRVDGDKAIKGKGTIRDPFVCNGVDKDAFVSLLDVLFSVPFNEKPSLTADEWIRVLDLSFHWKLDAVHSLAIQYLSNPEIDAIKKLELAKKYNIKDWIVPAIKDLVKADHRITEQDAARIGVELALRIARSQGMEQEKNSKPREFVPLVLKDSIEQTFADLLQALPPKQPATPKQSTTTTAVVQTQAQPAPESRSTTPKQPEVHSLPTKAVLKSQSAQPSVLNLPTTPMQVDFTFSVASGESKDKNKDLSPSLPNLKLGHKPSWLRK